MLGAKAGLPSSPTSWKRTAPLVSFSNANRKFIVAMVLPLWVTVRVIFVWSRMTTNEHDARTQGAWTLLKISDHTGHDPYTVGRCLSPHDAMRASFRGTPSDNGLPNAF
jgi:hypothetical protein